MGGGVDYLSETKTNNKEEERIYRKFVVY